MRYYLDTEFIEDGKTIDLISIALVSENEKELYLGNAECDLSKAGEWVKQNVIPLLPPESNSNFWVSKKTMRETILDFIGETSGGDAEFWGYYSDYDWVVFCQLFGRMIDLPREFPMFCLDLKQEMHLSGIPRSFFPTQKGKAHDALEDARWVRLAHLALIEK